MNKPAVIIEKRKPLTRAEFGQLMIDQAGRCGYGTRRARQPIPARADPWPKGRGFPTKKDQTT